MTCLLLAKPCASLVQCFVLAVYHEDYVDNSSMLSGCCHYNMRLVRADDDMATGQGDLRTPSIRLCTPVVVCARSGWNLWLE